jgi:hypothetical protein
LAGLPGVVAPCAGPQQREHRHDVHARDEPVGCRYGAFLQNAGLGRGGTRSVALVCGVPLGHWVVGGRGVGGSEKFEV